MARKQFRRSRLSKLMDILHTDKRKNRRVEKKTGTTSELGRTQRTTLYYVYGGEAQTWVAIEESERGKVKSKS